MVLESVAYAINLPVSNLLELYSPETHLAGVKAHLVEKGTFSGEGGVG